MKPTESDPDRNAVLVVHGIGARHKSKVHVLYRVSTSSQKADSHARAQG